MTRYARTYGSILHPSKLNIAWKYPTGPAIDTFGVQVPINNRTFGLEEFNFNDFFLEEKIAYIPCYGTQRTYPRPNLKELKLVYKINSRCFVHYATLYDVVSFRNNDIQNLRQIIFPQLNQIYFRQETQTFFGADYNEFQEIINRMCSSNLIADNHENSSFLINVKYKRIDILKKPVQCRINANFASQWFINAEYPSNCK